MKTVLIGTLAAIISFVGLALLSLQFFLVLPQVFDVLSLSEPLALAATAFAARVVPKGSVRARRNFSPPVPSIA
jgi:hypothetical protein